MCEIAWNIGQHCLLFCKLSANFDRAIPRILWERPGEMREMIAQVRIHDHPSVKDLTSRR